MADVNFTGNLFWAVGNKIIGTKAGIQRLQARHPIQLPKKRSKPKFNILVILTESLRKQNLGVYGYTRETTPLLKKMIIEHKNEFFIFARAFSNASYTQLSQPSLLTGIIPAQEAEYFHSQPIFWDYAKSCNYSTFYITSQSMGEQRLDYFKSIKSLDHSWYEEINDLTFYNDIGTDDRKTIAHFKRYIVDPRFRWNDKEAKFAGVLQFNANHYPYKAPDEFKVYGNEWLDRYDESILYQDWLIYSTFQTLSEHELLDSTIIFIMSDHGQAFNEHNLTGHIDCLYSEGISVPFIIYIPEKLQHLLSMEVLKCNVIKNISNVDLIPTIIDILDLTNDINMKIIKSKLTGNSLFSNLDSSRYIIICNENESQRVLAGAAVIHNDEQFIYRINKSPHLKELYNYADDPSEKNNLWNYKIKTGADYINIMRKFSNTKKILR